MHDQTTTIYGMRLQHADRSPQKKATLTSNIGALHRKRSQHQKEPALTKINGAHLLKWLAAFCVLDCVGAHGAPSTCPTSPPTLEEVVHELKEAREESKALHSECLQQIQELRECTKCMPPSAPPSSPPSPPSLPPPSPPPPSPPPPSPPPTPSPPPSTEKVVLTLTASGSVSDYSDNDKSSLQQKVAKAAGVDKSLVTISVAAASVLITATIAVPASKTADQVQTSLSSTLGTTKDASTELGVTVEEVPTITVEVIASDDSSVFNVPLIAGIAVCVLFLVVLLSAGACIMVRRQQKQNKPGRVEKPNPEAGYQYQAGDKDHDVKVESM